MSKSLRIQGSGLKGTALDLELSPVTLITGKNYVGKSAYRNALELLLLGYVPGLGKTNGSIFELASGGIIDLHLVLDGQTVISRSWEQTPKSIKAEKVVELDVPPVLLDLGSVFGLPAKERIQYFFRLAQAGDELTWEKITATIKNVDIGEATEASEKAIKNVVAVADATTGETIAQRLTATLAALSNQSRIVTAELKDLAGFARVQVRQQSELDAPVNSAQKKVDLARSECDAANVYVSDASRDLRELGIKRGQLEELNRAIENSQAKAFDESELVKLEKRVGELDTEIAGLQGSLDGIDGADAQKQLTALSSAIAVLEAEQRNQEIHLGNTRAQLKKVAQRRTDTLATTCCPTCGAQADGSDWRKNILATIAQDESDWKAGEATLLESLENLKADIAEKRDEATGAEIVANIWQQQQSKLRDRQSELQRANNSIKWQRRERTDSERGFEKLIACRDALNVELSGMQEEALTIALETARKKSVAASEALKAADADLRKEMANKSNELERQKSIVRRGVAEAEQAVLKAALKDLQELQQKAVANSLEPLLQTVRLFTDGLLKAPLEFHEGELGYWQGSRFVSHRTFSGTEEALAYTGLMAALASASDSPLRIAMIDEMGRFERDAMRPMVVERMIELTQQGVIDYFVGIDPDIEFCERFNGRDGVLVHQVGGGK